MNIFRNLTFLGFWTMISRITGFMRDIFMTHFFGASYVVDSFIIAFRLPNLFRRLFAEGAFAAAFVPIYGEILVKKERKRAQKFAGSLLFFLSVFMFALTIIMVIFMPFIITLIAPGFVGDAGVFAETVFLARICIPYLFFISLMSAFAGILNTHHHFMAGAAAPVLLNICFLVAFLAMHFHVVSMDIEILAWAVLLAGILQFLVLLYVAYKKKVLPKLHYTYDTVYGNKFLLLFGPAFLSSGLLQINSLVGDIIATTTGEGAISWLFYADRLVQLPIGIVGVSLSISLVPSLTRYLQQQQYQKAKQIFEQALILALGLGVPAMLGLYFLGKEWIYFLFERGAFDAFDTSQTASALVIFALAIPFWLCIKIITPIYFAKQDTRFPMLITAMSVIINASVALWLKQDYGFIAIAYAALFAAIITFLGLLVGLKIRHNWAGYPYKKLGLLLLIHSVTLAILWLLATYIDHFYNRSWLHFMILFGTTILVLFWSYSAAYYANLFPRLTVFLKK